MPEIFSTRPSFGLSPNGATAESRRRYAVVVALSASFVYVNLVGQVYPLEGMLAIYAYYEAGRRTIYPTLPPVWVFALLGLWLIGSGLSDIIAQSEPTDALKGVLRVGFLIVDILGLSALIDRDLRLVKCAWLGVAIAGCCSYLFGTSIFSAGQPWKFALGIPTTIGVALILSGRARTRATLVVAFLCLASVHFIFGFRSLASICVATSLFFLVRARPAETNRRVGTRKAGFFRLGAVAAAGAAATLSIVLAYGSLALQGDFGFEAQQKQSFLSGGPFGALLTSRSEIYSSVNTIMTNPVFGTGSYSGASAASTEYAESLLDSLGYDNYASTIDDTHRSFHSELLGMWAENGILAAFFWLGLLGAFLGRLARVADGRDPTCAPLIVFISIAGIWDIFFSPYGADRKIWVALVLVTLSAASHSSPISNGQKGVRNARAKFRTENRNY